MESLENGCEFTVLEPHFQLYVGGKILEYIGTTHSKFEALGVMNTQGAQTELSDDLDKHSDQ